MCRAVFKSCKNCQDREPGCHGRCEKYKAERAEYERYKAEADKDKSVRQYIYDERQKHAIMKAQDRKKKAGYHHL